MLNVLLLLPLRKSAPRGNVMRMLTSVPTMTSLLSLLEAQLALATAFWQYRRRLAGRMTECSLRRSLQEGTLPLLQTCRATAISCCCSWRRNLCRGRGWALRLHLLWLLRALLGCLLLRLDSSTDYGRGAASSGRRRARLYNNNGSGSGSKKR